MTIDQFTERLLAEGESGRLEFKASVEPMDSTGRTVYAFLNTDGGVVIAGVDEEGKPNGSATEDHRKSLDKFLREKISPRVLYDVSFDHTSSGNVISVSVPAGPDRPYVVRGSSLRPQGVLPRLTLPTRRPCANW